MGLEQNYSGFGDYITSIGYLKRNLPGPGPRHGVLPIYNFVVSAHLRLDSRYSTPWGHNWKIICLWKCAVYYCVYTFIGVANIDNNTHNDTHNHKKNDSPSAETTRAKQLTSKNMVISRLWFTSLSSLSSVGHWLLYVYRTLLTLSSMCGTCLTHTLTHTNGCGGTGKRTSGDKHLWRLNQRIHPLRLNLVFVVFLCQMGNGF